MAFAALGVRDGGVVGDEELAAAVDAAAAAVDAAAAAAADGADNGGSAGNGEDVVAVDAVAAVEDAIAFAALGFFNASAIDRDGSRIAPVTAAAAYAVAGVATHGLHNGAAGDGDIGSAAASVTAADVTAADAGTTGVVTAGAALGFYDGAAIDLDGSSAVAVVTAADAGSIVAADGGDVAACYLNGAGTIAVARADASSAIAACGSQAAGVAIVICSGCDGQFAGVAAILALFVVLEAGMEEVVGKGIAASECDFRVARALDAEGGVVFGRDVDIVQRHVESVIFSGAFIVHELVDDADDVLGRGLEVIRRSFQGRGRFVPGPFVAIGAGVRELAFRRRAAAGLGAVFLAAGGGSVVRFGVAAPRAGGVLRAGGVALRAGGVVGLVLVFLAAGGIVGLVLVFLAAGGVAGLVFVFFAAGGRRVALGVAEIDLVFGFVVAVVFGVKRGQIGLGGRVCGGAAFRRAAAGGAAFGRAGAGVGVFGDVGSCSALDDDIAVLVLIAEAAWIIIFFRALDIDGAVSVFGDCDVAAVVVNIIGTRIRRCGHAGYHCGCQRQRRHPVRRCGRGGGGVPAADAPERALQACDKKS